MLWDDLIRAANKAEAKIKIPRSTHLDQRYPRGKWPLKISLNSRDDQTDKKAPKTKEKANLYTEQEIKKPERSKKTEKARKK